MTTQATLSFLNITQQFIVNFTLAGGMIMAAVRLLQPGGNIGEFVATNTYIVNLFTPLNFLGTIYNMVVNALVDMYSFGQLLQEKSEVQDAEGAIDLDTRQHGINAPNVESQPMVEFSHVWFNYRKQPHERSIKDISFTL